MNKLKTATHPTLIDHAPIALITPEGTPVFNNTELGFIRSGLQDLNQQYEVAPAEDEQNFPLMIEQNKSIIAKIDEVIGPE